MHTQKTRKRKKKSIISKKIKTMYIVHGIWYSVIDTVLVSPADTVTYSYSPCIAQMSSVG